MTHIPHMGAYVHTRDALHHRYHVTLTLTEYETLCTNIREQFDAPNPEHHPAFIRQTTPTCCILRWRVHGMQTRLVYCLRSGLVITALPHGYHLRTHAAADGDGHFRKRQAKHLTAYRRRTKYRRQDWE